MKKVLFASTALVAVSLAGAAQAADPISLKLGGYSTWAVGFADNDDNFGDFQDIDVKGTNEVWFLGSTTLDNGIKIGVDMQLEAGGQTDTTADPIDEAYITVDGAFGRFILGSENNGAYLLHVEAPDAAGLGGEAEIGLIRGAWISGGAAGANATAGSVAWTTAINTDNDAAKITYVSPSFAGFTVGASYVPVIEGNPSGDIHTATAETTATTTVGGTPLAATTVVNGTLTDLIGVAAAYNGTLGGVGIKAALGYANVLDTNAVAAGDPEDHQELSFGAQFSYAGFTLGGGYKMVDSERQDGQNARNDGDVWNVGVMYSAAPFAVSFQYHAANLEGAVGGGEDSEEVFQFSGAYTMGPGVKAIASIGHVDYEVNDASFNDGWVVLGGLALSF